ncbi:hypothetical protein [Paracoccus ravus]|uniref:hypothetical protein n=1 Tax=Paracoccus ravus TaxID=2447760 RepID=UPI00106EC641|nr:hypothetical protein [Paracoccus ravus]
MRLLFERLRRSAEFRYDRLTAAARNRRLDAIYRAEPMRHLDAIDEAVTRACRWFDPQQDVSMSVLHCARQTLLRTGDARLGFVQSQMEQYRATIRDPAFRVLDPHYRDDSPEILALPDVMEIRPYYPVELMMIETAWADLRPRPGLLERLAGFSDEGGYGSTHVIVGGLILLENAGADRDAVTALMAGEIGPIARANDLTARAEDLFAERCMVLQWLGRHDLVRPAWIMRLLARQRPDGGWTARNIPPLGQSNQHTSILALASLAGFLAYERRALSLGGNPAREAALQGFGQ